MPGLGDFGIHNRPDGTWCPQRVVVECEACGWVNPAVTAMLEEAAALAAYDRRMAALLRGRRVMGRGIVHHIDGNPYNNDPANLRVVDPKENGQ